MGAKKKGKVRMGRVFPRSVIAAEDGFSLLELMVVLIVIGIMIGAGVIGYFATMRSSDVKASAEMVKEAIKKAQGLADSGISHGGERDRYRIRFNRNGVNPPNAYKIQRQEYDGSGWGTSSWVDVTPQRGTYMKLAQDPVSLQYVWVQPSSSGDLQVSFPMVGAETYYDINFLSVGSVVKVTSSNPLADTEVTVTSVSQSKSIIVEVNGFGDITYREP